MLRSRRLLQGITLSNAGVTATDGKQLLHLPCVLSLTKDVTIPFPSALLAAKTSEMGTLQVWNNLFQIEIGNFKWHGKLLEGQYPNWQGVIPSAESHDYSITLHDTEKVLGWLKMIPSQKTTNGVELNVLPDGNILLYSTIQPNLELKTQATFTGVRPRAVLTLDREIFLRMLLQGYNTFSAHSDGLVPVVASGGVGQYIAMPIRTINKNPIQPKQEEKKMEIENTNVVEQTAPVVNPLDELNTNVEEVALIQKQKERDFIQARRAIERIRMAI